MSVIKKIEETTNSESMPALLNKLLANMIDLRLSAKQAHWNVKGPNFTALHELFDKVSAETDEYTDLLAERIVQLNSFADGSLQLAADNSILMPYPAKAHASEVHLRALKTILSLVADNNRCAIDKATNAGDTVTADILTEVTRGLDKLHWMVGAHLA